MKKKIFILLISLFILASIVYLFINNTTKNNNNSVNLLTPLVSADYYNSQNYLEVNIGTVIVKRKIGEEETVVKNTNLNIGDTIIVKENSLATIYWFDDSISRLNEGTEITIDEADYNPININEIKINIKVVSGEVWSKVQSLTDKNSEFLSYTGNIVAGVRGTVYNHRVNGDKIEIETLKHAVFLGLINGDKKIIVANKKGVVDFNNPKIKIDLFKKDRDWYKDNSKKDKDDERRIMEKSLLKIKKRIGLLPGEKGYDKKIKNIKEYLESIKDPQKRIEMQLKFSQLQVEELLMLAINGGDVDNFIKQITLTKEGIKNSNLPEKSKQNLFKQLNLKLMAIYKILNVNMGEERLYAIKEILIKNIIDCEQDLEKKKWLENMAKERMLYSLYEWINDKTLSKAQFERIMKEHESEIEELNKYLKENPEFLPFMQKMTEEMKDKLISKEVLSLFGYSTGASNKKVYKKSELPKKIIIDKGVVANPGSPEVHVKPSLEIIENAPYYHGESNI